jgi:microcystin-dependent protein/cytoskeletal protein CcmA (bactofilin family)
MHKFTSNIPAIFNDTCTMLDASAQNMDLSGNLDVSGNTTIGGDLSVGGDTTVSSLYLTGNETVGGTLYVTEAITLSSLSMTGNEIVGGTLSVAQATTLTGNVGIGGASGTHKLLVTGSDRVTGSLDVSGDLVVTGKFNFNEVIQNITTVNNEVVISTQLDLLNEGTGPALKVTQTGAGDNQDVALFNAGDEGDAFRIDSSGNSHFYKDIDVSGSIIIKNNGNLDVDGNTEIGGTLAVFGITNAFVPRGIIVMWSGSITARPTRWSLCDGTNGTPDLRNRFIVGSGSTYTTGATGGNSTQTLSISNLPEHSHTGTTDTDGEHNHKQRLGGVDDLNWSTGEPQRPPADSTSYKSNTYIIDSANSSHQHNFTTDATGSGTFFDILPPYYALAYIIKL